MSHPSSNMIPMSNTDPKGTAMTTAFDRWLTTEPAFQPYFVDANTADHDDSFFDYAPADETVCSAEGCTAMIGVWLDYDPETTADIPRFTPFYVMDEDHETLFCEDCHYELTAEVEA